ncbi:DUF169 domain-containing protein [Chloroflexota bacterium]
MELKQISQAIDFYIRPACFPLALKILGSSQEIPSKARIPKRDLNTEVALCQAIAMGRLYGWTMAFGHDDHYCPYGALTLGHVPLKPYFLEATYWEEGMLPGTREGAIKTNQTKKTLEYNKNNYLLLSPLDRADFIPDLIVIYANSAQVMRLVQAAIHGKGGAITSSASGGRDCSDIIAAPLLSDECRFILPGGGDRIWGLTQDDEMVFSIPIGQAESVANGLEATHKMGWRYPIPSFIRFTPQQPPPLRKLMETLREPD